jgi:hypothetical protein
MSEIIGKQIELGVSMEGTRGTAESTADKWVKKVSADVIAKVEKVIDDSTNGSLEDSQNSRAVKKWFEGELAGVVHADAIGYFLKNLYGTSTPTTITGAVTSHLFAMLQNIIHPTLSIFAKDGGNSQEVFNGGVVNTLQIEATTDDLVRFNSSLMAKSATANSDTPSYDTEYDFIGKDITVKVASSEAGLSGATALELKNLSITWDAGAISDHAFGSYSPADIYNSKMSIEGSFVKNYTDDTFKDLYTADTAVYMQISIVGDTVLAGSNSPKLVILLNKVQIQEWVRSDSRDELVTEEVSFKAFYNAGDAEQSTVTLQNLTSDY